MFNKSTIPLVVVFLVFGSLILVLREYLALHGYNWQVLSGGNLFIYLIPIYIGIESAISEPNQNLSNR
jgi:hypothetical protein